MSITSLYGFENKEAAEKFYKAASDNPEIDAIFLGNPARIAYSREDGDFIPVEAEPVHTVLIVDRGTSIQVDTGSGTPAPSPAPTPTPSPTPAPTPTPAPGGGEGGSG